MTLRRRELLAGAGAALAALGGCAAPVRDAQDARDAAFSASASTHASASIAPDATLRSIAFGSCIDQNRSAPIWDTILAAKPDLFLFGGDNVYCESPFSLAKLRRAYAQAAQSPGMNRLRQSVPHLAIWDDHDYGVNDAGAEFEFKAESKAEFLDFWKIGAGDPRRSRDGLYHAQLFGPQGRRVQVILLDGRWFRSPLKPTDQRGAAGRERFLPDADAGKTMLGDAQWRWLEQQLRQPAELRLIVSGVQVATEGHGWERWGNFPLERQRLYRLIGSTGANGVLFLSGDRHIGALYREFAGTPYPLYELTSSGITHSWQAAREAGPNRLGELYGELHYGTVDIDWAGSAVALSVRDIDGKPRRTAQIPFSELKVTS